MTDHSWLARNRRLLIIATVLGIVVIISAGVGLVQSLRGPWVDFDTPLPPADLNKIEDPATPFTEVPSHQEALRYAQIITTRRQITDTEYDRILVLAEHTDYPQTSMLGMSSAAAGCKRTSDPVAARRRLLEVILRNLKSKEASVRTAALHILGNMQAKEQVGSIVPFLNAKTPEERSAARLTLVKLGYRKPEPTPKPE